MRENTRYRFTLLACLVLFTGFCSSQNIKEIKRNEYVPGKIKTGAERTGEYLPLLQGKAAALVANPTSVIGKTHLVDSLLKAGIKIKKVFCPEHGFRGDADAGEHVRTYKDKKTGLDIVSLYGKNYKPTAQDLQGIDVVVFDIQDVGVRFYTYISTLHYVMEACAENKKKLLVFDRPNPNGFYVDGPVLEEKYKSFVGTAPVPIVHGMTVGEYAGMLNGEGWLKGGLKCDLTVIKLLGYTHSDHYVLPVKPSPNLATMGAIYMYPSLCLFEGTVISVGRGTEAPFEMIGHPKLQNTTFKFTPKSIPGASKNPPYEGQLCYGYDLRNFGEMFIKSYGKLYLYWLQGTYKNSPDKSTYFNDYFKSLAGNETLKQQIINGTSEEEIRKSWEPGLKKFKEIRKKYLLYQDFE